MDGAVGCDLRAPAPPGALNRESACLGAALMENGIVLAPVIASNLTVSVRAPGAPEGLALGSVVALHHGKDR